MPNQDTLLAMLDERLAAIEDAGLMTDDLRIVKANVLAGSSPIELVLQLTWQPYQDALEIIGARSK